MPAAAHFVHIVGSKLSKHNNSILTVYESTEDSNIGVSQPGGLYLQNAGNIFPKMGNKLPSRGRIPALLSFNSAIAGALKTELGPTHQAIKTVVRWTGASERTVKHWFAGTHGPSGDHLVDLMANSDEVLKVIMERSGRSTSIESVKIIELQGLLGAALKCLEG